MGMIGEKCMLAISNFITKDFVWGQTDCTMFIAEHLDSLLGTELVKEYRGQWDSLMSAVKYSRDNQVSVESILRNHCESIEWGYEQDGDVFITNDPEAPLLSRDSNGIVFGGRLFFMTTDGLCAAPLSSIPEPAGVYRCHR